MGLLVSVTPHEPGGGESPGKKVSSDARRVCGAERGEGRGKKND